MNRIPLVIILGSTGTGKTKLSLEIAKKFRGEIISADSMQVYKALDIITAKATKEEQKAAPHHLLDIINPCENFSVIDFRNKALPIIETLLNQQKMPIVVGGTNYYIESLLWKILLEDVGQNKKIEPGLSPKNEHELSSPELHKMLQNLDPHMAKRLHPNNKRKILRSLEVLHEKGRKHSDILTEQCTSKGGSSLGGGLRYENALVFWLQCDQVVLDTRLYSRVDDMIKEGLLNELSKFHEEYNEQRISNNGIPDYTKGIFQSIGFKEFHDYLMLGNDEKNTDNGKKVFEKGVEDLKLITRRYAKKQNRWVTNRFLGEIDRKAPPVFSLNTTDVPNWNKNVTIPAFDIIDNYIAGTESTYKKLPKVPLKGNPNSLDDTFNCDICSRVFIGSFQYKMHQKSNKHKRMIRKINKDKVHTETRIEEETIENT